MSSTSYLLIMRRFVSPSMPRNERISSFSEAAALLNSFLFSLYTLFTIFPPSVNSLKRELAYIITHVLIFK